MSSEHADVSDAFIEALADYRAGRPPTGGDVESFESWLGQEPDHDDEIAHVPALLGMWLICPLEKAQLGERPRPDRADGEWLLVDERALVDVEEKR
ncbi:hypothetical protein HZS55_15680 [Halosimplex rubrum]|uniref:Uncharacterized protein n=1 Tax=Halosimplex rubrum TaxID=869889 RepID=A0A7D5PB15_9EURY|nr:hypothetical protein [Halosimplex rubrum]QLH78640.1 hypothetical protein HZS55_15680 [Halosimplex rubrum]